LPRDKKLLFSAIVYHLTENNQPTYEALPALILPLDTSIRFCGVTNKLGYFLSSQFRKGLKPIMTLEETERYALHATIRHSTRQPWESKIGRVEYTLTRYELLTRVTMPLQNNHFLLLSFDVDTKNIESILTDKIMPAISMSKL
jgi:hypothetical protein